MAHRLTRATAVTGSFFLALSLAPAAASASAASAGATVAPAAVGTATAVGTPVAGTPVVGAPVVGAPVVGAPKFKAAAAPVLAGGVSLDTARAKVTYPKGSRGWQPITYTWTVWKSYIYEGNALVLYTDINRDNISKVRWVRKAPNAKCGVRKERTDYNVYCIVTRPEKWKRFSMSFKVWPKYVTAVVADHYWGPAEFGGSVSTYISYADSKLGRTRTKLYY